MSENKRYWYLKLKDTFFDSEEMKIIEGMDDGYLYSNIFLKMCLMSLKNEGKLMLNGLIPYNSNMIATITRHQVGTVERALKIFREIGLIEVLDDGAIYMMTIQGMIGESSSEADRKRAYRERIAAEKLEGGQMSAICPPNVHHNKSNSNNKSKSKSYSEDAELDKAISDFVAHRKALKKPMTDHAVDLFIKKLNSLDSTKAGQIAMIEEAIERGWQTVYKHDGKTEKQRKYTNFKQRDYDFADLEKQILSAQEEHG